MSKENVDLLRASFAAWNRGDMDAVRELLDPDVVMHAPTGWPEPGPELGRDAVIRQFERLRDAWDADSVEPVTDFIDAGDQVVVRIAWHTVGQGPGSRVELTQLATFRNGKLVRSEYHWDHEHALEAVGVSEQDVHADPA